MEKLFFKETPKTTVYADSTKTSSNRDRSDISSRWNEVTSRKEPPERNVDPKKNEPEGQSFGKKLKGLNDESAEFAGVDAYNFDEESAGSPLELFQNIAQRRKHLSKVKVDSKKASMKGEKLDENANVLSSTENSCCVKNETKENITPYEELSKLNPLAGTVNIAVVESMTEGVTTYAPTVSVAEIEALIHKIVDEVQLMTRDGCTETTITIKNSSTFADVRVTITEFDSAKKEFNISFQNLTQRAHEIVSMQQNREVLKSALEQKGYHVHIITATTEIEEPAPTFRGEQERNSSDKHEKQQQQQQQEQEQQQ